MMFRNNTGDLPWEWQPSYQPTWTPWKQNWTMNMWMTCPKCAKLVQWGSVYCPTCGEKMYDEIMEKDKLEQILEKLDEILKELRKDG